MRGFDELEAKLPPVADGMLWEDVRLYRMWSILPERMLGGCSVRVPWLDGWNTARCHRAVPMPAQSPHPEPAPKPGCDCGFWAYWLPEAVNVGRTKADTLPRVFGVVEVAGAMRRGQRGAKVERARVAAVVFPDGPPGWFAAEYPTVKVYRNRDELMLDFPPTDTTPLLGMPAEDALAEYARHPEPMTQLQVSLSALTKAYAQAFDGLCKHLEQFAKAIVAADRRAGGRGLADETDPRSAALRARRNRSTGPPVGRLDRNPNQLLRKRR